MGDENIAIVPHDDERKKFKGQTSPSLAGPGHVRAERTGHVFDQLHKVRQRRYFRKRYGEWSTRILFSTLVVIFLFFMARNQKGEIFTNLAYAL